MATKFKKPKIDGWYRKKSYPHFDSPLSYESALSFLNSFQQNPTHAFYPFLAYEKKARRFKGHNSISLKKRPIKYASHKDGYIYSFYAKKISENYELRIAGSEIEKNIIAYRSGKGNNVDFARDAFNEIDRRGDCTAIALDISGFFDNIDHQNLKKEWCLTINETKLPADHFAVFNSLTKWAEIERDSCYKRLEQFVPDFNAKKPPNPVCSHTDFHKIIKGRGTTLESLVKTNSKPDGSSKNYGIPQGTPMSALLSNIYMLPFDQTMCALARELNGYYRRYSDDILWICATQDKDRILNAVDTALRQRGTQLIRKDDKTEISSFKINPAGKLVCDKTFQYLGFTYDGKKRLLRSSTLAKYWRRLIYATRSAKREAWEASKTGESGKPLRKKLNQKLTHLGRGNFVTSYAYKSQIKMGGKGIRKQLSGHLERISKELAKTKVSRRKNK